MSTTARREAQALVATGALMVTLIGWLLATFLGWLGVGLGLLLVLATLIGCVGLDALAEIKESR